MYLRPLLEMGPGLIFLFLLDFRLSFSSNKVFFQPKKKKNLIVSTAISSIEADNRFIVQHKLAHWRNLSAMANIDQYLVGSKLQCGYLYFHGGHINIRVPQVIGPHL